MHSPRTLHPPPKFYSRACSQRADESYVGTKPGDGGWIDDEAIVLEADLKRMSVSDNRDQSSNGEEFVKRRLSVATPFATLEA